MASNNDSLRKCDVKKYFSLGFNDTKKPLIPKEDGLDGIIETDLDNSRKKYLFGILFSIISTLGCTTSAACVQFIEQRIPDLELSVIRYGIPVCIFAPYVLIKGNFITVFVMYMYRGRGE